MGHARQHALNPAVFGLALRLHVAARRDLRYGRELVGILQFFGQQRFQFVVALAFRGGEGQHGDAQTPLQQLVVDLLFLCLRHVHHVQQQHRGLVELGKLRDHVHAALQLGGVHQDADQIRLIGLDEIGGDDLLVRISGEAVAAGKVGDGVARAVVSIEAVVLLHGLAGPVAHMLPGAGQRIVDGRFAGVRLAQKGDRVFHTDSTSILSASARLMAISVSRR